MNKQLQEKIQILEEAIPAYIEIAKITIKAYDCAIYHMDFYALAVINRSISLIRGFASLIKSRNYLSALHLVRPHLDNLVRFYAAFIVNEPHDFVRRVINGEKVRDLKDKDGNKMTDFYLVSKLNEEIYWAKKIYTETCGYIHLRNKHIYATLKPSKVDKHTINCVIGHEDEMIPLELVLNAIESMSQISLQLLKYLRGWAWTKDNPDKIHEILRDISPTSSNKLRS